MGSLIDGGACGASSSGAIGLLGDQDGRVVQDSVRKGPRGIGHMPHTGLIWLAFRGFATKPLCGPTGPWVAILPAVEGRAAACVCWLRCRTRTRARHLAGHKRLRQNQLRMKPRRIINGALHNFLSTYQPVFRLRRLLAIRYVGSRWRGVESPVKANWIATYWAARPLGLTARNRSMEAMANDHKSTINAVPERVAATSRRHT